MKVYVVVVKSTGKFVAVYSTLQKAQTFVATQATPENYTIHTVTMQ